MLFTLGGSMFSFRAMTNLRVACQFEHIPVFERRKAVGTLPSPLVIRPDGAGAGRNRDEGKLINGDQATDDHGQASARAEGPGEAREEGREESRCEARRGVRGAPRGAGRGRAAQPEQPSPEPALVQPPSPPGSSVPRASRARSPRTRPR